MVKPLLSGTMIRCGEKKYIIQKLIARGGTSFVYSAQQEGSVATRAIKEACPYYDRGLIRKNLLIESSNFESSLRLWQGRAAVLEEENLGHLINKKSTRTKPIWETLIVDEISIEDETSNIRESVLREKTDIYGPGGSVFYILEQMEEKGQFLSQIIDDRRSSEHPFDIREIALIIKNILEALTDVHGLKRDSGFYLHGDLSPGNIFFEDPKNEQDIPIGAAYLLDFGCSREVKPDRDNGETEIIETVFSSPRFAAPEMRKVKPRLTQKVDVFAVGCILLELLDSLPRYLPEHFAYQLVGKSAFINRGASPAVASAFYGFLKECLEDDVEDRLSLQKGLWEITEICKMVEPPRYKLSPNLTLTSNWVKGSRRNELARLHKDLDDGKKPVWIWGFGGIGKSELARKLGQERHALNYPAFFISYKGSMKETILSLNFEGYEKKVPEDQMLKEKVDILRRYYEGSLFILDNYEPENAINDNKANEDARNKAEEENRIFQDFLALPIQVVITTRSRPNRSSPELKELSEEELLHLFRSCDPEESATDEEILQLIRKVEMHPLTVELMASTIAAAWCPLSVSGLLEKGVFNDVDYPAVVSEKDRKQKRARISGHIKTLFQIANLSEIQKNVLCQASFLPQRGIDATLFWSCETDKEQKALESLEQHSWLRKEGRFLRIHPLVRALASDLLKESWDSCELFFERLNDKYKEETVHNYLLSEQIAEMFTRYVQLANEESIEAVYSIFVGNIWAELGRYEKALVFFQKSKQVWESMPKEVQEHPEILEIRATAECNIGVMYNNLGQHETALIYLLTAKKMREQGLPRYHRETFAVLNNLGTCFDALNQHEKAIDCFQEAMNVQERLLPPNHPDLAITNDNLGCAYYSLKKYEMALEYHMEAMKIRKMASQTKHHYMATIYNNIGNCYSRLNKDDEAAEYYSRAISIFEEQLSPYHPKLAAVYHNAGIQFGNIGKHSLALKYLEKAETIYNDILPADHPSIASNDYVLGIECIHLKRYDKAIGYLLKAKCIWERILPQNHPKIGMLYYALGNAYGQSGLNEEAVKWLQFAEKILVDETEYQSILKNVYQALATAFENLGSQEEKQWYANKTDVLSIETPSDGGN